MPVERPIITADCVETLCDKRFVRLFDLQYAPGRHYYDATRRTREDLVALKSDEEALTMLPDAVSCVVILCLPDREPQLLLSREYRYPAGRWLLSVPAGLIDPEDRQRPDPLRATAIRELKEETGLSVGAEDSVTTISPFAYSTPGMTDESNALVCCVLHPADLTSLDQSGAVGTEAFDGFVLLTEEKAREVLLSGRDTQGHFYSMFTWAALMWFMTGMWKQQKKEG